MLKETESIKIMVRSISKPFHFCPQIFLQIFLDDHQEIPYHERSSSQPLSLNTSLGVITQNVNRRSDGASSANGRHSRSSAASRSFEEEMRPPARKPYMNPGNNDNSFACLQLLFVLNSSLQKP